MKAQKNFYVTISDFLIRNIEENKKFICVLFVCNLTYFVNTYMILDFREINPAASKFFIFPATYLLLEIFVVTLIFSHLPKIFGKIFVAATVILFCIDSFTLMLYRSVFDKGMFQILLDTNIQEVAEYIGDYSNVLLSKIFFVVPFIILLVLLFKVGVGLINFFLKRDIRVLRCSVILILMSLIFLTGFSTAEFFFMRNPLSIIRVSFLIPRALNEIREYREVYKNLDSVKVEITRNDSRLPWVIFILGESTNRNHMSVYGYDKATTPNLQRRLEKNELILFTDCISGATETMPACQRIFTFYDNRTATDKPWYRFTNLFDILKAAGYHTAWLSNQEVTGIYGNVPRAYADRCNEKNLQPCMTRRPQFMNSMKKFFCSSTTA